MPEGSKLAEVADDVISAARKPCDILGACALDRRKSAAATRVVSGDAERMLDEREGGGGDDPSLAPDRAKVRKVIATLPDERELDVIASIYFDADEFWCQGRLSFWTRNKFIKIFTED